MSKFDAAFTELLGHEGGYSNNPADPGGETMWGVTARVARAHGYTGPMRDLPVEFAKKVYRKTYWLDVCDALPYSMAFQIFDGAVNSGLSQSVLWAQRAIHVNADGVCGPMTAGALLAADPGKFVCAYNAQRLLFMAGLRNWPTFSVGWARRIAHNLEMGAQ